MLAKSPPSLMPSGLLCNALDMRISHLSGPAKFLSGLLIGAFLFGSSAVAVNNFVSDNTPENGFLLCANTKTKVVTFPNRLSCPSGTRPLDMGAVTGVEGPEGPPGLDGFQGLQGPMGPQGPAGASSANNLLKLYSVKVPPRDIVFDGNATTLSSGRRTVLAVINGSSMPNGIYTLRADLSGIWSSTASAKNPIVSCFFQEKADYDAAKAGTSLGSTRYGSAKSEFGTWTGINLNVNGDGIFGPSSALMYLVCVTTGSISGLDGMIWAQRLDQYGALTLGTNPLN